MGTGLTFIKARMLLDGNNGPVVHQPIVVVCGDRIVDILTSSLPEHVDGHVIDLGDKVLMPGMWDVHVHMLGIRTWSPAESVTLPHDLLVLRAAEDCRKMLMAGITAVRDCGSVIALSLARAIKAGSIPGPHMWASGKVICQTGGHGDTHYLPVRTVQEDEFALCRLADGADECRKAAREMFRQGADFLKICTSGGVGSEKDHPLDEHYTLTEIQAITEEAHRAGKRVASHAQGAPGMKNAIRGGVDTIEHGFFLDQEAIELMLQHGTYFVPTLSPVVHFMVETMKSPRDLPPWRRKKQPECIEAAKKSFAAALTAGVHMSTGSDYMGAPLRAHGDNADEPVAMVKYGMKPSQAIVATTRASAECLGVEKEMGTIEKGKIADIIGLNGNPLDDITVLKNGVEFVMKAGTVFRI